MSGSRVGAWKGALLQVHILAAALPLLCLLSMLGNTAQVNFQAARELYPRIDNDPTAIAEQMLQTWRRPQGRVLAVWGLGDGRRDADSPGVRLLHALAEAGVRLRVSDPRMPGELLPPGANLVEDPAAAAEGAHGIVLMEAAPPYTEVDLTTLVHAMQGNLYFDLTARADGLYVDLAGLQLLAYGAPLGPPWLDPELQAYAEHLRERIPAGDGILLVPAVPPGTLSGRARWFLHLNYRLFPRRLYLQDAAGASGTSVQFRQWVLDLRRDFPRRTTQRWEPEPRELSGVTRVGPVRTLTDDEKRAIEEHDVQWVTYFVMTPDFRLQDWETMPAAEALAGPQ